MITIFGGFKGGTGKTTFAANLAVSLANSGRRVLMIDADPQQSLTRWSTARHNSQQSPTVTCLALSGKSFAELAEQNAREYDDVIIDTRSGQSVELRAAMTIADRLVVPLQPSQFDLWTLNDILELNDRARQFNKKISMNVVLNRAPTLSTNQSTQETVTAINEIRAGIFKGALIADRLAFQHAAMVGQSVTEWKPTDHKAVEEMQLLHESIIENRPVGDPAKVVPLRKEDSQ